MLLNCGIERRSPLACRCPGASVPAMSYLFEIRGRLPPGGWPWPLSAPQAERMLAEVSAAADAALTAAAAVLDLPAPGPRRGEIEAFLEVYARRPLTGNRHGSGFNDSLWLWLAARWLEPDLVVESGTFMGHSAWLFRQACPAAAIVTHDVELPPAGRLRAPGVDYRLADWSAAPIAAGDPARALCFFDDHISHARRLAEARACGFALVLLDDDFPSWQLHATGAPPLPSLSMLLDEEPLDGAIEWQRRGKHYAYDEDEARRHERRVVGELVAARYRFPDLSPTTRQPPGSNLTLVRLAQKLARKDDTVSGRPQA